MRVSVEWGHGERTSVATTEDLDALLDRIDQQARASGLPQDVQLIASGGEGTLGVVVGADRSVLNHVPVDGDPPYMTSLGDEDDDRLFTFYVAGDHHSESHWRHTVPALAARAAARRFLLTGQLDPEIRWTEV